jgi:hypothetical protein
MLKSAGLPESAMELVTLMLSQGMDKVSFRQVAIDDPNWAAIGSDPERRHMGVWIKAEGPTSRATAAVFYEGVDDESFEKISAAVFARGAGDRALAGGVPPVGL